MKQFVDFENDVNKFDEEINGLIFGNKSPKKEVTDEDIN